MCLQIDDFCYAFWMALLFMGQIAGFVVGFMHNDDGPIFEVDGYTLSVAKGSGRAIQV